jgi:hypothetical protein
MKNIFELACAPQAVLLTETGPNRPSAGNTTVKTFVVAVTTVALVAPKYTMSFAGVALKLLPVIVTIAPLKAKFGDTLLTTGAAFTVVVVVAGVGLVQKFGSV